MTRKKQTAPTLDELAAIPLPSDRLRELKAPETFRVWHCPSDPHQVGEFVVTISPEGLRIWESFDWQDAHFDQLFEHDTTTPDHRNGHTLSWFEAHLFGGRAIERMRELERDTRVLIEEAETWQSIRDAEAHRILRAREIKRMQNMRRILQQATKVSDGWMRSSPRRVTWRDMVRRSRT